MKKVSIIFAILIILLSFSSQNLKAQDIGMNFYINFGLLTDDSFSFNDYLWSAGANLDIHIGPLFMLTPECDILVYKFDFDPVILAPALMANIKLKNFFFGAGITKWFLIGDSTGTIEGDFALKVNLGLRTSNLRLLLYGVSYVDDLLDYLLLGVSLGFGF
jgi:hypothetical protein